MIISVVQCPLPVEHVPVEPSRCIGADQGLEPISTYSKRQLLNASSC